MGRWIRFSIELSSMLIYILMMQKESLFSMMCMYEGDRTGKAWLPVTVANRKWRMPARQKEAGRTEQDREREREGRKTFFIYPRHSSSGWSFFFVSPTPTIVEPTQFEMTTTSRVTRIDVLSLCSWILSWPTEWKCLDGFSLDDQEE